MNNLFEHLKAPNVFESGTSNIWTNTQMSNFVLDSHLNSSLDGASKDNQFIEETISLIQNSAPPSEYKKVIDMGCGPGLFCEKLVSKGYHVTGIDISDNSIKYAKKKAQEKQLNIEYRCEDFLYINESNKYDVALLIYQIYGLFNPSDRKILLENAYNSLKKGGLLIMDVLSEHSFDTFQEQNVWSFGRKNSLLSSKEHIGFSSYLKYPNKVTLSSTTFLFKEGDPLTFNYWDQHFSKYTLDEETNDMGFSTKAVYSDVNGEPFTEDSESIAVILEKL